MTDKKEYPIWEELLAMKEGTRLREWNEGEVKCVIIRSSASLCAYLGIPANHRLAGKNYDLMGIYCHGGLTFSDEGDGTYLPKDYWFYGWDYAHVGDYPFYADMSILQDAYEKDPAIKAWRSEQTKWLVQHVLTDMQESIADFQRLKYRSERWWLRMIDSINIFFGIIGDWFRSKYYTLKWELKSRKKK